MSIWSGRTKSSCREWHSRPLYPGSTPVVSWSERGPIATGRGLKRSFWGRARWSRKVQHQLLYLTRWLALWFQFYRAATEQ